MDSIEKLNNITLLKRLGLFLSLVLFLTSNDYKANSQTLDQIEVCFQKGILIEGDNQGRFTIVSYLVQAFLTDQVLTTSVSFENLKLENPLNKVVIEAPITHGKPLPTHIDEFQRNWKFSYQGPNKEKYKFGNIVFGPLIMTTSEQSGYILFNQSDLDLNADLNFKVNITAHNSHGPKTALVSAVCNIPGQDEKLDSIYLPSIVR